MKRYRIAAVAVALAALAAAHPAAAADGYELLGIVSSNEMPPPPMSSYFGTASPELGNDFRARSTGPSSPSTPALSFDVGSPVPFATAQQATAEFNRQGLTELQGLEQVGDYWAVEALVDGKPSAAYLFSDGTLSVRDFPLAELERSFGRLPSRRDPS
jgi:hypothetical protein